MLIRYLFVFYLFFYAFDINAQYAEQYLAARNITAKSFDMKFQVDGLANNEKVVNMYLPKGKAERHPMEKVGRTLTFLGLPLLALGLPMVLTADSYSYQCQSGYGCEGDAKGAFGSLLAVAGAGLSITGAILWSKGSKKELPNY